MSKNLKIVSNVYHFLIKKINGNGDNRAGTPVKVSAKPNQKLRDELHKAIIKKLKNLTYKIADT